MKIETYQFPKSSFLSVDKDMSLIISYLLKNERLKKLLYYTTKDCLDKPNLTDQQTLELIQNNIRLFPKLYVDPDLRTYIVISFDNFTESKNPEFRDNTVEFDIICHMDQWNLGDFKLRPFKIAGEIDSMLNNQKLTGIGRLQFLTAQEIVMTDEFSGLCLMYQATHGGEDQLDAPMAKDEIDIVNNFDSIFNKK